MTDKIDNFDYDKWWEVRTGIKEEKLEVESSVTPFRFLKLTDEMKKVLISLGTVNEKLCYAAENGLSYNRSRIIDNENLNKDFALFWADSDPQYPPTPSIKHQSGEFVCEISGLLSHMEESKKLEDDIKKEELLIEAHKDLARFNRDNVVSLDTADASQLDADTAQHELMQAT